jgi:hypothetical protein
MKIADRFSDQGRYMNNFFIERLGRSLKYEAIFVHELTEGFKAERVIRRLGPPGMRKGNSRQHDQTLE